MEEFWDKNYYPDGFNGILREIWNPMGPALCVRYSNQGGKETMKIKVNRLKLIASLEAKLQELNQKVEDENKGVFDDVPRYEKEANACIEFLNKRITAYKAVKKASEFEDIFDSIPRVEVPQSIRTRGQGYGSYNQQDAKQLKQLIARLNLSDQVEVECDDNADYLKFL